MANISNKDESTHKKLLLETARIPWKALQYFFARNMAIYVSDDLDLVAVATDIAKDKKSSVEQWMRLGKINVVTNVQAKQWNSSDAILWAVVVKPWVLVQETNAGITEKNNNH